MVKFDYVLPFGRVVPCPYEIENEEGDDGEDENVPRFQGVYENIPMFHDITEAMIPVLLARGLGTTRCIFG